MFFPQRPQRDVTYIFYRENDSRSSRQRYSRTHAEENQQPRVNIQNLIFSHSQISGLPLRKTRFLLAVGEFEETQQKWPLVL